MRLSGFKAILLLVSNMMKIVKFHYAKDSKLKLQTNIDLKNSRSNLTLNDFNHGTKLIKYL